MPYSAIITITKPQHGLYEYLGSLNGDRDRSKTDVENGEGIITIKIEGKDLASFRASMNATTQTLAVFETAQQNGQGHTRKDKQTPSA